MTPEEAKTVLDAMEFINMPMSSEHYWLHAKAIEIMREEVASTRSLTAELKAVTAELEAIKVAGYYSGEAAPQAPAEPISDAEIRRLWIYEAGKAGYNIHELPVRFVRAITQREHNVKPS